MTKRALLFVSLVVICVAAGLFAWYMFNSPPKVKVFEVVAIAGQGGLVNGSREVSALVPEGSKPIVLVAEPETGYTFIGWFRDGKPVNGSRTLVLVPQGNVTLYAKFKLIVCKLQVVGRPGVEVYVNGSVYKTPFEIEAPWGSKLYLWFVDAIGRNRTIVLEHNMTLNLEMYKLVVDAGNVTGLYINNIPVRGVYEGYAEKDATISLEVREEGGVFWKVVSWNVNGKLVNASSLEFKMTNDTVISLEAVPYAKVKLEDIRIPVKVNGTLYDSDAEISVPLGSNITVVPYDVDKKGCRGYNDTHFICVVGWNIKTCCEERRWDAPSLIYHVTDGVVLEQRIDFSRRQYPVKHGEIFVGNRTVEVKLIPADKWMIVPFLGTYEYLGNGWFKFSVDRWQFFMSMPEGWSKVRIYANYSRSGGDDGAAIMVVVRNDGVFKAVGWGIANGKYIIVLDRRLAEKVEFPTNIIYPGSCEFLEGNGACGVAGKGPANKVFEGIEEGWLEFVGRGVLYIKFEVIG